MIRHESVAVGDVNIHVAEAGPAEAPAVLFLHGWPESWRTWQDLMALAGRDHRAVVVDLPGIGDSTRGTGDVTKLAIARVVHALAGTLGLRDLTLVGHDIGGMVASAYLREFTDLPRTVIMDVPVPGVDPWEEFVREPFLTARRHEAYFGYFFDLLSAHPGVPSAASRAGQAAAYAKPDAMSAGFGWYRAFAADVEQNQRAGRGPAAPTPLLVLLRRPGTRR